MNQKTLHIFVVITVFLSCLFPSAFSASEADGSAPANETSRTLEDYKSIVDEFIAKTNQMLEEVEGKYKIICNTLEIKETIRQTKVDLIKILGNIRKEVAQTYKILSEKKYLEYCNNHVKACELIKSFHDHNRRIYTSVCKQIKSLEVEAEHGLKYINEMLFNKKRKNSILALNSNAYFLPTQGFLNSLELVMKRFSQIFYLVDLYNRLRAPTHDLCSFHRPEEKIAANNEDESKFVSLTAQRNRILNEAMEDIVLPFFSKLGEMMHEMKQNELNTPEDKKKYLLQLKLINFLFIIAEHRVKVYNNAIKQEAARIEAEAARIEAETLRIEAETLRIKAKALRTKIKNIWETYPIFCQRILDFLSIEPSFLSTQNLSGATASVQLDVLNFSCDGF